MALLLNWFKVGLSPDSFKLPTKDSGAKAALNDGVLLRACRDAEERQKDESPF
jgi:hypothetical protein